MSIDDMLEIKKQKVAVFDIDGTIFRSSLTIELTDALIQEGVFPKRAVKSYARAYQRWLDRKGSYVDYIRGVVDVFEGNIKGVRFKDFDRVAKKVVAFHAGRVYRYTRDLVKELKQKGYFLLAISGSPTGVVKEFCRRLGFNKVYGRWYELDKREIFTGEMIHEELIIDKSKILRRAVEKHNLTLKGSVGVGDTEGDIPMLKMVARPICFNSNSNLYRHAKRAGWEVVVERKDVIYFLK